MEEEICFSKGPNGRQASTITDKVERRAWLDWD